MTRASVVPQEEDSFEIIFDGRPVRVRAGQSVGAALLAAGVRSLRTTRFGGRPRGLFCGIGMCFDCLVVVNHQPPQRACLRTAAPGDVVTTAPEPDDEAAP